MKAALALLPLLAACATQPACPPGLAPAAALTLALGRNGPDGPLRVTEDDWTAFLAEEATPRFPDGLTALDATGRWRAPDGTAAREPAKLLWIVLPRTAEAEAAARGTALAAAYARRFGQEAVILATTPSCTALIRATPDR